MDPVRHEHAYTFELNPRVQYRLRILVEHMDAYQEILGKRVIPHVVGTKPVQRGLW